MDLIRFNYASLILLLTVFQGGLYSLFLLLGKHRGRLSSRLLGCFTLVFTLHFANILLTEFGPFGREPNFNPVFGFCYGPLLLLFIRSLIQPHFTMRGAGLHFIVPLAALALVSGSRTYGSFGYRYLPIPLLIHLAIYLLVARRTLRAFRRDLQDRFSAIDTINLDWLTRLLNQVLFILGITIVHFVVQEAGLDALQSAFSMLIFISALYFVNTLVLKGMSHPSIDVWLDAVAPGGDPDEVFGRLAQVDGDEVSGDHREIDPADEQEDGERYRGSGLSSEESRAHFARLGDLMDREEPFLDENLNIHQLAAAMGITAKHLSQVINQNAGQNFYDFINSYRIEKAKALLLDPDRTDLRVSEIMFEVGYAAKSTFNSLFKRSTGLTPTEFRRQKGPSS